jgi:SAM-dependent methyltransferase
MNDIMEDILKWSKNELLQNWFRDEEIFLKSFLKDKNIETVLDVGCGTGRTIDFLLSNFKFKKIVGIEKNPDLVKYLKEKYSKYNSVEIGWTNIIFPEKSYYKLDEKFDLVLCMGNTLGTILNWKLGLKRILERSKKYVILSVYDNMKSIETRKKVYESLGFKIKSIGKKSVVLDDGFKIRGFEKKDFEEYKNIKILDTFLGFIVVFDLNV